VHKILKDKQGQEGRLVQKQNNMNNEKLENSRRVSNSGIRKRGSTIRQYKFHTPGIGPATSTTAGMKKYLLLIKQQQLL
jgi:hypothetical protein